MNAAPQFGRYLLVGVWNTAFGYGLYAAFTALLSRYVSRSYLPALVLSNLVSITVAFLGYKWFVFKTQGNYVREWLRCASVYSGGLLLALATLPFLVYFFGSVLGYSQQAPYLAGVIQTGVTAILSFFGHRHISFRNQPDFGRAHVVINPESAEDIASNPDRTNRLSRR